MRLVICDDEVSVLSVMKALCERVFEERQVDVELVTTSTSADALTALQNAPGRVRLVTDYNLGDSQTGCDLIRQACEMGCALGNVAIVSGLLPGSERPCDCAGLPVRSWAKPLSLQDVRNILDWVL